MNPFNWHFRLFAAVAVTIFATMLAAVAFIRAHHRPRPEPELPQPPDYTQPVRPLPATFRPDTHLPTGREAEVSGSVDLTSFSPGRSLTYIDDDRVWWESDNDKTDTEDDHTIHRSLEAPLRRLIESVCARGGVLKVQDTYRPEGIHNTRSLHKEGRAIDLTCEEMPLGELAKLCWAAGFDWVYYEASSRGGAHVHCSVRREPPSSTATKE